MILELAALSRLSDIPIFEVIITVRFIKAFMGSIVDIVLIFGIIHVFDFLLTFWNHCRSYLQRNTVLSNYCNCTHKHGSIVTAVAWDNTLMMIFAIVSKSQKKIKDMDNFENQNNINNYSCFVVRGF